MKSEIEELNRKIASKKWLLKEYSEALNFLEKNQNRIKLELSNLIEIKIKCTNKLKKELNK